MSKRVLAIILLAMVSSTALVGCGGQNNSAQAMVEQKKYIPVNVLTSQKGTLERRVTLTGKVSADKDIMVLPKVTGKVEKIHVKVGERVKKDQVLFSLDKKDLKMGLDKATSTLKTAEAGKENAAQVLRQAKLGVSTSALGKESAKASYDMAKANYESGVERYNMAKARYESLKKLYETGAISKSQLEEAELAASESNITILEAQFNQAKKAYEQAQSTGENSAIGVEQANAAVKQAEAAYEQAKLAYNQAKDAYEDGNIKAPTDGIITQINISEDAYATGSQPSMMLTDMDKIFINLDVSEMIINKIHEGDKVDVVVSAVGNDNMQGTVYSVSQATNAATNLYPVTIEIDNKGNQIKPGMFAKAEFVSHKKDNSLIVKSESVLEIGESKFVFVIEENKAVKKEVKTGMEVNGQTEILEGISQGQEIVVKGQEYLNDSSEVKIIRGNE